MGTGEGEGGEGRGGKGRGIEHTGQGETGYCIGTAQQDLGHYDVDEESGAHVTVCVLTLS